MKKYIYTIAVALSSSVVTLLLGAIAVCLYIVEPFHKEAVDRGFASWEVIDNATGKTKFAWNEFAQALHPENPNKIFDEIEKPISELNKGKK